MNKYQELVEKGVRNIVQHKWHKIFTMDEGVAREQFLKDICAQSPIIPNYGEDQCSGIYIHDRNHLTDGIVPKNAKNAFEKVVREYYNLLIFRSIIAKIVEEIRDVEILRNLLGDTKKWSDFKGSTFTELFNDIDASLTILYSCYQELITMGEVEYVFIGNKPIELYDIEFIIGRLHRTLGNSYSNFALIFDADKNLSKTSKQAINSHISKRTKGYKVNVICERKIITRKDLIDENEKITIKTDDWGIYHDFQGDIIEDPNDYITRDYTDELNEAYKLRR